MTTATLRRPTAFRNRSRPDDGAARALMARLDARFGADPDWIKARDAAADLAAEDWAGQDLATLLAGGPRATGAAN